MICLGLHGKRQSERQKNRSAAEIGKGVIKMNKALFESLKQGLKEAAAIRRGKLAPGRVNGNQCARCEINSRKNRIESG
jgi:hypothetical protein